MHVGNGMYFPPCTLVRNGDDVFMHLCVCVCRKKNYLQLCGGEHAYEVG